MSVKTYWFCAAVVTIGAFSYGGAMLWWVAGWVAGLAYCRAIEHFAKREHAA